MKKLFALLIALMMVFSLVACDLGNTEDPNKDNPGTSQNGGENNNGGSNNNGGGNNNGGNNNGGEEIASDEIVVENVSRGYSTNDGLAIITVSFARPNGEAITFAHPNGEAISLGNSYSLPVESGCFSIAGDFTISEISVKESSVTVYYAATEDNYDQVTSITYTPASDPLIKTTGGEAIEGFTYEVPYYNFDLYE